MDKSAPTNEPHPDAPTVKTEPTQPVREVTGPPVAQIASPDDATAQPAEETAAAPEVEVDVDREAPPEGHIAPEEETTQEAIHPDEATRTWEAEAEAEVVPEPHLFEPETTEASEFRPFSEPEAAHVPVPDPEHVAAAEEFPLSPEPFTFEPAPFTAPPELQFRAVEETQPPPPEPIAAEAAPIAPAEPQPVRFEPQPISPPEPELTPVQPVEARPGPVVAASLSIPELIEPIAPQPAASDEFVPFFQRYDREQAKALAWRAGRAGVLIFCGWFIAVVILIAVYRFVNPPFSTLMAMQWLTGTQIKQQWEPIGDISPNLVRAVITSEDGRFCRHWGIDYVEVAHAIQNSAGGLPRGASTISMQVAKNLFLWPSKSYIRKAIEVPVTYAIELLWTKRRIMEVYLNIAEWGPGVFGAQAASQAHFGRSASRLTTAQAARLAVALPNPFSRDAGDPGPWTRRRANLIQRRAAASPENAACVLSLR